MHTAKKPCAPQPPQPASVSQRDTVQATKMKLMDRPTGVSQLWHCWGWQLKRRHHARSRRRPLELTYLVLTAQMAQVIGDHCLLVPNDSVFGCRQLVQKLRCALAHHHQPTPCPAARSAASITSSRSLRALLPAAMTPASVGCGRAGSATACTAPVPDTHLTHQTY